MEKNQNEISKQNRIQLTLYVVGINQTAQTAINNLKKICEKNFPNQYNIEIVDLNKNPKLAVDEQIFAVPTVVKKLPLPMQKVIGDLSDSEKVLVGLDLYNDSQYNELL